MINWPEVLVIFIGFGAFFIYLMSRLDNVKKRNAAAYHLKPFISDHRYREILSEKVAYYIQVQASKHEEIIKQRKNLSFDSMRAIEEKNGYASRVPFTKTLPRYTSRENK